MATATFSAKVESPPSKSLIIEGNHTIQTIITPTGTASFLLLPASRFVIRKNGKSEVGTPQRKLANNVKGKNIGNLGICLTGNFQKYHPTKKQYSTLRTVLTVLKHAYQISPDQVFLHKDLAPTLCPGKNFNPSEIPSISRLTV